MIFIFQCFILRTIYTYTHCCTISSYVLFRIAFVHGQVVVVVYHSVISLSVTFSTLPSSMIITLLFVPIFFDWQYSFSG
jgi:hypothetical protein